MKSLKMMSVSFEMPIPRLAPALVADSKAVTTGKSW